MNSHSKALQDKATKRERHHSKGGKETEVQGGEGGRRLRYPQPY